MYNANIPSRAELPTSGQLLRSTAIAAAAAAVLLVTVVLPAEYGIDPTGVGDVLGLTEMGEIKASLAEEAAEDARAARELPVPAIPAPERRSDASGSLASSLVSRVAGLVVSTAAAAPPVPAIPGNAGLAATAVAQAAKSEQTSVTLRPGEAAEVKVRMRQGARTDYSWKAEGGVVNHDTHGEPFDAPDKTLSYRKGRGVESDQGTLLAAFDGNHGWFWRNRGDKEVTVTLNVNGEYTDLKRMK